MNHTIADLADSWTAEAARYRMYAEESSIPGELKSIARTLEQCAAEVRSVVAECSAKP